MLAGRAIKYMSRGFSLALSPAAATAIAAHGLDFDTALTVAQRANRASTPSMPVLGLGGLKRRQDFVTTAIAHKLEAKREARREECYDREAFYRKRFPNDCWDYGRGAYYGRFGGRARHFQRLDEDVLHSTENEQIHEDFWQYNLVDCECMRSAYCRSASNELTASLLAAVDRALVGLVTQVGRMAKMFDQETFGVSRDAPF